MEARQQKFISYAWLALTLFYLFLRYQNIPGVFSDVGIITIDTDPYYRLHRIRSIIQSAWTYPLLDPSLNYPEGFSVAWPLGLDYLIAAPLKLLGIQNHSSIMITALLAMPIITLPILFLTGLVATQTSKNAWVGLGAGLFVTLMNVLLQQTAVGRLDHHGLEALFALLVLWFLAKIKQSDSNVLYWGFIVSMGLSPSFYPHAWVPVGCAAIVMSFESDSKFSQRVSLAMFIAFALSLIPLSFSDRFAKGEILLAGFSWWPSLVLLLSSVWIQGAAILRDRRITRQKYGAVLCVTLIGVLLFLSIKNGYLFFGRQMGEGLSFVFEKRKTLSITSEMKSPFEFSWDFLGEKILLWLLPLTYGYLSITKKYKTLLIYSLPFIVLSYLQVRFLVPASGLIGVLIVLFLWEVLHKIPNRKYVRESLLFVSVVLISYVYMPHLGMVKQTSDSAYFQPIQHASIFLKKQVLENHFDPKKTSVLATWDYGHWILFYSGLPVVATPFQGYRAAQNYEVFASESPQFLEDYVAKVPTTYLIVEQFPGRFYNVLKYAGKNPEDYFNFVKNPDGTYQKMSPKLSFDKVLYQRFLKNYGADDQGYFSPYWRLVYTSPYPAEFTKDAPALKVFERVKGAVIQTESKENQLWLQITVQEKGVAKSLRAVSTKMDGGIHQWTVPYSQYEAGDVSCDGIYRMMNATGKVLGVLPTITQKHVTTGEVLFVR